MAATSTGIRSRVVAGLECLAIVAVMIVVRLAARRLGITSYVGPATIVLVLALATWLLARDGSSWRTLGFVRPLDLGRAAAWAIGTFLVVMLVLPAILQPIAHALALAPQDFSRLGDLRGSTLRYLIFLIPIAWGTAAFGEELVYRGFLNARLTTAFGAGRGAVALAAVMQALLFGAGHAYLGPLGVLNASAIGLVSACAYLANGRNLWPVIIAHGLVDSVGLTVLRLGLAHAA
jgi:CAAX protease family protein